jgi:hypothetical protein
VAYDEAHVRAVLERRGFVMEAMVRGRWRDGNVEALGDRPRPREDAVIGRRV